MGATASASGTLSGAGAGAGAVRLRGLDPAARYVDEDGTVHHGAVLQAYGLVIDLPGGDHASAVAHLRRELT